MHRSQLGSYSRSGALSAEHYKLVDVLQQATSVEEVNGALLACLSRIRRSWEKKAPSPSRARHDLILLLYCREQRLLGSTLRTEDEALFRAEWALPTAGMLAGGGGGGAKEKAMGYRACAELFTSSPHPLKLLLINTIRSDLHVESDSPQAEGRRTLALRAIANPVLATPELSPAVRERVLELLSDTASSDPTRRLALDALLSLVRVAESASGHDGPSALIQQARQAVLFLLLPPPPSATSSSSGRRRSSRRSSPPSLPLLAAFASTVSSKSPLHPLLPTKTDRVQLAVKLSRQVLGLSAEEAHAKPTKGFWALSRTLSVLEDALRTTAAGEALPREVEDEAKRVVWQAVERALEVEGELANGTILSALRILPHLNNLSTTSSQSALVPLLKRLHSSLLSPTSPSACLFSLRCLALLPPSTWASTPSSADEGTGKGKGRASSPDLEDHNAPGAVAWDETAFRAILSGLDHPDSFIRKATLALLARVDGGLVKLHYQRLLQSLSTPSAATGSAASVSSTGSTAAGRRRTRARVVPLLLEVLPYLSPTASSTPPISSLPPASALLSLLAAPELALSSTDVVPEIVLPVLEAFQYVEEEERRDFAKGLVGGRKDGQSWTEGMTVMRGLLLAGTVHVLAEEDEKEAQQLMAELTAWLANAEGSTSPDLLSLLQEPFLFAFLRLLVLSPPLPSSTLSTLNVHLSTAASSSSPSTTPLFHLALGLTTPDGSGATSVDALQGIARETREKSLAEFSEALLAAVEAADQSSSSSSDPTPLAASVLSQNFASPSVVSSRLHHPVPPPAAEQPLRYSAYPSSSSSHLSSASPAPTSPSNPFTSLPSLPASPPSASTSAAARARERADLLREREDRGGRGVRRRERERGGGVESLMGAGELALRAEGMGLGDRDEEEEQEEVQEEKEGKEKEGEGNALGLSGAGEAGLEEGAVGREGRSRQTSGTSSGAGEGGREAPTDLLLSLAHDDDPFHAGGVH